MLLLDDFKKTTENEEILPFSVLNIVIIAEKLGECHEMIYMLNISINTSLLQNVIWNNNFIATPETKKLCS